MAYKKEEMIQQCLKAIEDNNLVHQYEIFAFVPFSQKTFHNHKLQELQDIKGAIDRSVIKQKIELRNEFRKSKSAAERIVLYRLLASEQEFSRIASSQFDHTSGGDKIQPLNINVTKDENAEKYKKHIEKLAQLN